MLFRRIGIIIGAWLMLLAAPYQGQAQENFPNRPIRIVIPYSPGSVTDVFARIIGQNMRSNGQVKSGANGSIAAEEVARAAPDGLAAGDDVFHREPLIEHRAALGSGPGFYSDRPGVPRPNFFVVPTALPVTSVAEFVALAKAKPGELNYHPGKGSTGHLGLSCSSGWRGST